MLMIDDFGERTQSFDDFNDEAMRVLKKPLLVWYGEKEPAPAPWLIKGLLPQEQIAIIAGQSMAGKTFVGIDLSFCTMTGTAFVGHEVVRPGAVLWFAAEGQNEVAVRLKATALAHTGSEMLAKLPFAYQAADVPRLSDPDALAKLIAFVEEAKIYLDRKFRGTPLAMIVIDTLGSAANFQDENNASEAQRVMSMLRLLSTRSRALVLVIDHYGKIADTGIRGSSAKTGAADAILGVLAERAADGTTSNRRIANLKQRSGATGKVIPFALKQIQVDDSGATHCAIEWGDERTTDPAPTKGKSDWVGNARTFKASMEAVMDQAIEMRPFGYDGPMVKAVAMDAVRIEFRARYPADSSEAKKKAFTRLRDAAVAKALIASREIGGEDYLWFVRGDTDRDNGGDRDTPL